MKLSDIILAPIIWSLNVIVSVFNMIYGTFDNFVIIPVKYIGRVLKYGFLIPVWPIMYWLEFDTVNVSLVYDFCINLMHFLIVGGIFGIIIGYIISQNLLLLKYLVRINPKPNPMSLHLGGVLSGLPTTIKTEDEDMIKQEPQEITSQSTLASLKSDPVSPTNLTMRVYEDDDGYYPRDTTLIDDTTTPNTSLFDRYTEETKLSSILEDQSMSFEHRRKHPQFYHDTS